MFVPSFTSEHHCKKGSIYGRESQGVQRPVDPAGSSQYATLLKGSPQSKSAVLNSQQKNDSQAWWHMLVIPSTGEAEEGDE